MHSLLSSSDQKTGSKKRREGERGQGTNKQLQAECKQTQVRLDSDEGQHQGKREGLVSPTEKKKTEWGDKKLRMR